MVIMMGPAAGAGQEIGGIMRADGGGAAAAAAARCCSRSPPLLLLPPLAVVVVYRRRRFFAPLRSLLTRSIGDAGRPR